MNDVNEKDQISGLTEEHGSADGEVTPGDVQNREERQREADCAPNDYMNPAQNGYWSNTGQQYQGGQNPHPGPYPPRGGNQVPYTPPYYNNQRQHDQNSYQRGGYGYGQQQPYSRNQGYQQQQGGCQQYEYGTNSGWQQPPPPPPPQDNYEWKFEDYDNLDITKREKKKRNRGVVVFTVAIVCFLSIGLVALSGYSLYMATVGVNGESEDYLEGELLESQGEDLPSGELEIATRPEYSESLPIGGKMTIPQVAETVLPSVVGVIRFSNDQTVEVNGLGSGIVMNEDGYIITNAHVVSGGTSFKVQLYEGETYDAILIGDDIMSDLAVLKIEAESLMPAQFGDSTSVKVGETVVAVGNPAGLELAGSVTQGIISAVNRAVRATNNVAYIQTDAAINPGNSGGALANEYGQVIGINSSKIVAEGYEGIGFAIPVAVAKPIIDELIANGRVTSRAMLGIKGVAVDAVGARTYGERGILIGEIYGGTDLIANGAQAGDIITHIDGQRIYTLADLRRVLDSKRAGDTVTLTLYRRVVNQETNFEVETRLVENNE